MRWLNVGCRTAHLAAFGLVLGGHAWGVEADRLLPALWATLGSGLALIALECRDGPRWLLEGRGLMVLIKLGLLLAVPFAWEHRTAILLAVVVVASVGSHMPGRFRHASALPALAARRERLGFLGCPLFSAKEKRHEQIPPSGRHDRRPRRCSPPVPGLGGADGPAPSAGAP